jgi:hypothetical protein
MRQVPWGWYAAGLALYCGGVHLLAGLHAPWSRVLLSLIASMPGILAVFWGAGLFAAMDTSVWRTLIALYKRLGVWRAVLYCVAFQINVSAVERLVRIDSAVPNAIVAALAALSGIAVACLFWFRRYGPAFGALPASGPQR